MLFASNNKFFHLVLFRPHVHTLQLHALIRFFLLLAFVIFSGCGGEKNSMTSIVAGDSSFTSTLPKAGKLINDKPVGKNWINLSLRLKAGTLKRKTGN